MSAQSKLLAAVVLLIAIGGGLAYYKTKVLEVPFWEGERVEQWLVEAKVSFVATGREVKARLSLPAAAASKKLGQESGSLDYHYTVEDDRGEYTAVWSSGPRDEGQALYYSVQF